jgi:uncharacterized protein (DUF302 family)
MSVGPDLTVRKQVGVWYLVRASFAERGFGVLTEIDVKLVMKKKLDADMKRYQTLGACNPNMTYKAIEIEPHVGAMLPCNVNL